MTIYYVDPESGDDTKNGLSFANRWKTLKPIYSLTAQRGDEFRFKASKAPYSLGTSTWVDNQEFVTVADTSAYAIIDMCEDGWIAPAPNLLSVLDTATSRKPVLTRCTQVAIVNANFTGKLCYKALPATLNLSAFTHISMILANDQQWPFAMKLSLCSDNAGAVPLAEFTIEKFRSHKFPALLTNGGAALPAGVNSIALHVMEADSHTFNYISIDNIIACLAPGAANHVSHGVAVSRMTQGEPEWLPVRGFKAGGQIYLGSVRLSPEGVTWRKWRGPAGQTELFAMQATKLRFWLNKQNQFPDSASMEFDMTGGWNRADMSVRDSVTWLHGEQSRMLGGGQGSANPDLPSAADTVQALFVLGQPSFNINVLPMYTVKGFGLLEFTEFPVPTNNYYTVQFQFAGISGVGTGAGSNHGPFSSFDMGDVTFCRSGAFTEKFASGSGPNASLYQIGPGTYKCRKISATSLLNWFPTTNIGVQRVYQIDRIENCDYGVNNQSVALGNESGYSKLTGTKFRWCTYDAAVWFNMHLERCLFLDDITGLPTRQPNLNMNSRPLLQVRLDSVNGKSWDTRAMYQTGQYARVKEGIGRSPDKRTLEISASYPQQSDSRLPLFVRERVALVVARAGIPCTVSGYVKQSWKIDGDLYTDPQYACLCTVDGETRGVPRVEGMNLQRPNKWGRVVVTFTSEEDALVPIYLETNGYEAWATEVSLDDSGLPPDPIIPIPPPAMTDSIQFVAVYERILDALDAYEAGSQLAEDALGAMIGVPFARMSEGTVLSNTPGHLIGVAIVPEQGTLQGYAILSPGYQNDGPFSATFGVVKNAAGVIIAQGAPANAAPTAGTGQWLGYGLSALMLGNASEIPVDGGTYTYEIWRGEAG